MRFLLLLLVGVCVSCLSVAQTAEIRGFVYLKTTGEPAIFTNVYLKGTTLAAKTDVNGFYSITKITAGSYTLLSTGLGYDTATAKISIKDAEKLTKNLYLNEASVNLNTVDINSERTEALTDVRISTTKISPKQINQIPSVGGQPDLAQYLQVLPGVVFTGDQGGQLYIRGGAPIQNKVIMDGMVIYNPFHSIGLFSVFDVDVIRNVDVYTGGFNAEYGGRVSAIMDITTRDGNKKRFSGKASASPFISRVVLEGPLNRYEEGKTSSSFIVTGKTSYIDQSAKTIYKYADKDGLPYTFTDLYGKVSINGSNGNKVNLFGFNFTDKVAYFSPATLSWTSRGFGTNVVLVPPSSSALISGNFAYSDYSTALKESSGKPRKSGIGGFNAGLNFAYFFGNDELKYGVELLGFRTDFSFTNAANVNISQETFTTEIAGFARYKYVSGLLVVEPSFRAHYYASLSELSPEPRLGIKYLFTERARLKIAAGLYSQNLLSATSDRDVVNLFYGFLSAPENLPKQFDGKDVTSALQKAQHVIAGVEYDITRNFTINIEGYIKYFNQLTSINRDKIYDDNVNNASKPDFQKKDFVIETGIAKGADAVLKYENRQLYVWLVYSLAYVDCYDGIRRYNPHYDRRHTVNLVTSYKFGKNKSWEADVRWNFGSGFPFTKTQGFYEKNDFSEGINTNYTTSNGELSLIYAELNGGRLPYYHRLDIGLKKKWKFGKYLEVEAVTGATNVYNRENIFYFDRIRYTRKNQLPILPTAGINISF